MIEEFYVPHRTGVFLSGGIDSAIVASYLPAGTPAYTFQCQAPGAIDETEQARQYCKKYDLKHEIIEMSWSDFEELTPSLLKYNLVPFHSIEVQLVKAALHAKKQGIDHILIGTASDCVFGGMDKLLSKDWTFDEFVKRYTFVEPSDVLESYVDIEDVYEKYRYGNTNIDFLCFMKDVMDIESYTSYMHAFDYAGVSYRDPYTKMKLDIPLDLDRIRKGEPKYLIRELFSRRYPDIPIPTKIPMPRAMDQWLQKWSGPQRKEFKKNCVAELTGDQKWLCWCLEQFLDMYEKGAI